MTKFLPFCHDRRPTPHTRPRVHPLLPECVSDKVELQVYWWIDIPLSAVQRRLLLEMM